MNNKIVGISGAHGTGKSTILAELSLLEPRNIIVDDFKVSRTVLKELGLTLEQATSTIESTKKYQSIVLEKKIKTDRAFSYDTVYQNKTVFVDRTLADVYAYTRHWYEQNNIDKEWFAAYEKKCADHVNEIYENVIILPTGKIPFVADGVRPDFSIQEKIAEYVNYFAEKYIERYVTLEEVSIEDRVNKFIELGSYFPVAKKISILEANLLILEAKKQVSQTPTYRLGQGVMNLLPKDLYTEITGTKHDFFHETDDAEALATFYEYCVDTSN